MKSITPRQQDRRNKILECTRQQVAVRGYDGVNMRELADEADVSTATLYNLFKSKDDLILAASQDLLSDVVQQTKGSGRGIAHLVARIEAYAEMIIANPKYADAMGRMLFTAEPSAPVVNLLISQTREQSMRELREMREDNELLDDIDLERLSRDIVGVTWSVILMWMKGFIAMHDFRREYVGRIVGALLPWLTPELDSRYREKAGILL
ncbi:MAG: TetR/AcrR family transcriptional regulator [Gammaproteobacteria bacterium]|jgi:TetR/AcrR family transcriptional regulator, cholesterol catabolism regulator|nr:TetR/AcrR family transcriptional regulator [Gammaproteobacteria bacterium]MBT4492167.1 TetR/AcrR family transcriptional regulator [Gammaproteobacteria bacterium]MBT7369643.1 TetR/AcrR family transcriptional regulator [Gammaproteobacteria bacterium]